MSKHRADQWKAKQEIRRQARAEHERIMKNVISTKPWWLPTYVWGRLVASVLATRIDDGQG